MKRIVLILLTALAFSCAERELQLPVTTANDITEILDVSPIYLFYDEATDSVDFNRKNMISTTNWLVNIDRRLTLKQILPHLQYLQEKRRGDGMHKNENAKNRHLGVEYSMIGMPLVHITFLAIINFFER